jgi:hypothetical protein
MKHAPRINRFATLAIIPLVAIGFYIAIEARPASRGAEFEPAGRLVVANLRAQSLTFFEFADGLQYEVELAGPPHEMAVIGDSLFVSLGRHDAIAEVDLRTRAVERYLVLAGSPHGMATDGSSLFVTLDTAAEVVVLDPATLTEQRRFATGDTPHAIVLAGATALVTNSRDNTLGAYGTAATVRETGELPESVAILGTSLVVSANAGDGSLSIFALPGLNSVGAVEVGGRPVRVLATPSQLLVADARFGRLLVLHPVEGGIEIAARIEVGRLADGICGSPDGRWVGATANGDSRLVIVDAERWLPSAEYDTGDGPGACLWLAAD